jgi:hypothetical protein
MEGESALAAGPVDLTGTPVAGPIGFAATPVVAPVTEPVGAGWGAPVAPVITLGGTPARGFIAVSELLKSPLLGDGEPATDIPPVVAGVLGVARGGVPPPTRVVGPGAAGGVGFVYLGGKPVIIGVEFQ